MTVFVFYYFGTLILWKAEIVGRKIINAITSVISGHYDVFVCRLLEWQLLGISYFEKHDE